MSNYSHGFVQDYGVQWVRRVDVNCKNNVSSCAPVRLPLPSLNFYSSNFRKFVDGLFFQCTYSSYF